MDTRWNPFVKQLVIVGLLIGAIWLLARVSVILTPLILTGLLAYLVSLPANWVLRRTGWPRAPVVAVSELVIVVLLLTVPAAVMPSLVNTLIGFTNTLVTIIQELLEATPKPLVISPSLTIDLGPYYEPINQWLRSLVGPDLRAIQNLQNLLRPVATGAAGIVRGAISGITWLILVLAVSFYLVRDAPRLARAIQDSVPEALRPEFSYLWRELTLIWDAFVRGQLILGIFIGVTVWIIMTILGVRNAPALGLVSGLLEFVPAIGPFLAAIPGVALALVLGSTWLPIPNIWFAVLVAVVYFLIQQFENIYLLPKIIGGRIRLHPAVVIVGALAGAQLGGMLGILLAAPTIAAGRLLIGYTFRKLTDSPPFPVDAVSPDPVTRWHSLRQQRKIGAILFDLDGTLIETDDEFVARLTRRLAFLNPVLSEQNARRLTRRWLMASELWVNGIVTWLDRLHLDGVLFRLSDTFDRLRGLRSVRRFVVVAGVVEMLEALAERYTLGVVTSRSRAEAQAFLAQHGLTDLFQVVITREDSRRLKPHPMPVQLAARRLSLTPEQCVLVGDTSVDVRAARAAGALSVGVLCGFGEPDDLVDADLVIPSTAGLEQWL